jgi:hypothetical protein
MTTESKGRREPVQHGFLPCIAGGEWSGWCDFSCDRGFVRPALTDRIALAKAAQLRDFNAAPCCCCTHTWRTGSALQETLAFFPPMTPPMIWSVRYVATLQNRQRAKSNSDVKIMNGCPLPHPSIGSAENTVSLLLI